MPRFIDISGAAPIAAAADVRAAIESATWEGGRVASDFGIGPNSSAAENAAGFTDAIDWATSSPVSRTLIIPPMADDEYITISEPITLPAGFRMAGFGASSRFWLDTEPDPCFIAEGQVHISGLYFEGPETRTIATGDYAFGLRDQYGFLNFVGVLLVAGSDGSVVRNIHGKNVSSTVAAWAWDSSTDDYVGTNIQRLVISDIYSEGVWSGVFWREVDNISVSNIYTTNYRNQTTEPTSAPPHGIYCNSTSGILPTERFMYGGTIHNVQVKGGDNGALGGAAVSFKHLIGAHISDITAYDCPGLMDASALHDCVIENVVGIDDCTVDNYPGAVNIRGSERSVFKDMRVNMTTAAEGRMLFLASDNTPDVEVRDFKGRALYATGSSPTEAILIRCGTLIRPDVRTDGTLTLGRGIARLGTSAEHYIEEISIIDPTVAGEIRRPLANQGSGVARWDYDYRKVSSDLTSGYPKMFTDETGASFTDWGLGPSPEDGLVGWSDPRYDAVDASSIASSSSAFVGKLTYLASGHEVDGDEIFVNDAASAPLTRWVRSNVAGVAAGYADFGFDAVELSIQTRSSASGAIHGVIFNRVDSDNYLTVEIRSTAVAIRSLVAGTPTDVATYAFTRASGRHYHLRAAHHNGKVSVWLDGKEVLSDQAIGSPAFTAYGSATVHGYYFRDGGSGSYSAYLRVRPLST